MYSKLRKCSLWLGQEKKPVLKGSKIWHVVFYGTVRIFEISLEYWRMVWKSSPLKRNFVAKAGSAKEFILPIWNRVLLIFVHVMDQWVNASLGGCSRWLFEFGTYQICRQSKVLKVLIFNQVEFMDFLTEWSSTRVLKSLPELNILWIPIYMSFLTWWKSVKSFNSNTAKRKLCENEENNEDDPQNSNIYLFCLNLFFVGKTVHCLT